MNRIFLILGGGALLYWWYSSQAKTTAATTTGTTTGTTTTTTATPTTTPTPTTTAPAYNSLAATLSRLQSAAGTGPHTPDEWNWYLAQQSSVTPPDPLVVWPGIDRTQPMTISQYWGTMSAYLATNLGMSGLGRIARQVQGGWAA